MPARTLPPSPDPALSPPRFHPRHSPHISSSSTFRRDSHDDRLPQDDPRYALAMPAQLVRLDPAAAPPPPPDQHVSPSGWPPASHRVYPDPASIPPHWQIHPASLAQFRDGRPQVAPGTPLPNSVHLPWTRPYPLSGYPRIVPVQPFAAPPPPPIPHKVWILDCKSCGMFLTNRGMKAVLLLRPNVPLYSTDALPINCSAFSPPSEVASHAPSLSVSSSSGSSSAAAPSPPHSARSSISGPGPAPAPAANPGPTPSDASQPPATAAAATAERPPSRTCECLTQTLCCHGCGNAVGYMIVAPCQRCTSSITANNRATNGHRFVFYSSEITAGERHYVPGERGVSPFHPPPAAAQTVQTGVAGMYLSLPARQLVPPLQSYPPPSTSTSTSASASSPTSTVPSSMPSLVSSPVVQPTARVARRTSVDHTAPAGSGSEGTPAPASPVSPGSLSPSALAARSRAASMSFHALAAATTTTTATAAAATVPPAPPNSHSASPHAASAPTFSDAQTPARARAASTSAAGSSGFSAYRNGGIVPGYIAARIQQQQQQPQPQTQQQSQQQQQQQQQQAPEPLRAGEVVYWHHLTRSGEIPAVAEDARARMGADAQARARERAKARGDTEDAKGTEVAARSAPLCLSVRRSADWAVEYSLLSGPQARLRRAFLRLCGPRLDFSLPPPPPPSARRIRS
ncbi:hypothetical protein C8Q79DRAFT_781034 [Trametes meyenii]|nr:hypothetical protein C8Q79DRAFT_781034 [Trametes meyenii]